MEASPLTQQARPGSFLPKIAQLYDDLFRVCSWSFLYEERVLSFSIGQ